MDSCIVPCHKYLYVAKFIVKLNIILRKTKVIGGPLLQFVTLLTSCKNRPQAKTLELGPLIITLVCDPTHVERI
jgi:hypothetical protein